MVRRRGRRKSISLLLGMVDTYQRLRLLHLLLCALLLVMLLLAILTPRSKRSIRTSHFCDHLLRNLCCFGGDGFCVFGIDAVAAGVGVATGGDEEGEVDYSMDG